ncbi:class I adenylate-forming enzyme family protein [Chelatococcus reniformis]|uniref:AMP-binding protein n=1 Tax=Chelatococcus reniformis TaxID=1494448 RepID=A0A916UVU6_9HYPH|nr:AMP-binding protein [Chelatococcus reniformis]GGC89222.1 AMP-binding protein [Chelatococcus reniformis]
MSSPLFGALPALAADQWPERVALTFRGATLTFGELEERVDLAARGLLALGLRPGDKVGLLITNRPEFVIAIFAALRVGCVAVPLNTRYRENDLAYVLARADCRALITVDQSGPVDYLAIVAAILPELSSQPPLLSGGFPHLQQVIVIGARSLPGTLAWPQLMALGDGVDRATMRRRQDAVSPGDLALVIFTSGTTGHPKGVMHDHSNLRCIAERNALWRLAPGEVTVNYLPMFHLYSLSEIVVSSLLGGVTQIVLETFDAEAVLDLVESERVNIVHGFDTHYADLLRAQARRPRDLASLRFGTFPSGMDSTIPVCLETQSRLCPTVTGIGSSETWSWIATCPIEAPEDERCRLSGRPLPGVEIRMVDPATGTDVPEGTPGEMLFRGYTVMKGYFADPEATAAALDADGWYHSGDQGIMYANGCFRFTGRYKEMLKVGGENVSAQGVEFELKQLVPAIEQVAVVPLRDERLSEVPVAYVVMPEPRALGEDEIIAACRGKIASFKIPRHVFFVDELPQTPSGKVQRYILKARAEDDVGRKLNRGTC